MAVVLREISEKDHIKVIAGCDDAIEVEQAEDGEKSSYQLYLEDLDESRLKFVEGKQPTRFVMRLSIPPKYEKQLDDGLAKMDESGKVDFRLFSSMFDHVRMHLIDIENPPGVEHPLKFVRHNEFGACEKLIQNLKRAGIVSDLYTALQNAKGDVVVKKK